ncbi:unnamed protein product, partial [Candidula unifasciata]
MQAGETYLIKQEPPYITGPVETEHAGIYAGVEASHGSSTASNLAAEESSDYCVHCQVKYAGSCPIHGPPLLGDTFQVGFGPGHTSSSVSPEQHYFSSNREMMELASQTHSPDLYTCGQCYLLFPNNEQLDLHLTGCHRDMKPSLPLQALSQDYSHQASRFSNKKSDINITHESTVMSEGTQNVGSVDPAAHFNQINSSGANS